MYGETPLLMASKNGDLEVVQALLAAGANSEARERMCMVGIGRGRRSRRGGIHEICEDDVALCMQDPDMIFGMTPLIMASNQGHLEVVQALLAAGANKEAKYLGMVRGGGSWEVRGGEGGLMCTMRT